jgi:hypothetical protein
MDELGPILAVGFVFMKLILLANRPDPNYEALIAQCRGEATRATVQRVYHDMQNVAATEAICGVRDLKLDKGTVVTFERPVTIVQP